MHEFSKDKLRKLKKNKLFSSELFVHSWLNLLTLDPGLISVTPYLSNAGKGLRHCVEPHAMMD